MKFKKYAQSVHYAIVISEMDQRSKNIRLWVATLIFAITVPLRAQALILCIESNGETTLEFTSEDSKCSGCPDEETKVVTHPDDCEDCRDVSFNETIVKKASFSNEKPECVISPLVTVINQTVSSVPTNKISSLKPYKYVV